MNLSDEVERQIAERRALHRRLYGDRLLPLKGHDLKLPDQVERQTAASRDLQRQLYGERPPTPKRRPVERKIAEGKEIERQVYGERSPSPDRDDMPKTWGRIIVTSIEDEATGISGDKDGSIGAALALQDRRAERAIQQPSRKRDALRQPEAWRLVIDELVKGGAKLSAASRRTRLVGLIKDDWAATGAQISSNTARTHAARLVALARRISAGARKY